VKYNKENTTKIINDFLIVAKANKGKTLLMFVLEIYCIKVQDFLQHNQFEKWTRVKHQPQKAIPKATKYFLKR
jgi:hypothetical protein